MSHQSNNNKRIAKNTLLLFPNVIHDGGKFVYLHSHFKYIKTF